MTLISASTFNPLARYVNVRLGQGVPIVDADINELDDIRQFELRAFLKWFVGDGVPDGNDGFRIQATGAKNDFTISAGRQAGGAVATPVERGLRNVGRIIVDGLDATIAADISFTEQPLHEGQAGADALAARLGVPKVAKLTSPDRDGTVAVYLDVWETLVTADDDAQLLHAGLGIETCSRVRRDWVVRVRDGDTAPTPTDADGSFRDGHSYSLLAVVARRSGHDEIRALDVIDSRQRRLQIPPATLVEDVMGGTVAEYRSTSRRPPISLREALNALLHGELPMTPDSPVAKDGGQNTQDTIERAFLHGQANDLVAVFTSTRSGTTQTHASRMSLDDTSPGFGAAVQLTTGVAHTRPSAAELSDGSLFVVYQSQSGPKSDIFFKNAAFSEIGASQELPVAATPDIAEDSPFVVAAGALATVFFRRPGAVAPGGAAGAAPPLRWHYRRWNLESKDFVETPIELAPKDVTLALFHAALDNNAKIVTAFIATDGIWTVTLDPADPNPTPPVKLADLPGGDTVAPFVLCPRGGDTSVFWHTPAGIITSRFVNGAWTSPAVAVEHTAAGDRKPCAVEDADGFVWLIFHRGDVNQGELFGTRRDAFGKWGEPRPLVTSPGNDTSPFAVAGSDTTVWLFWSSSRDGRTVIYDKRLVTAV